MITLKDWEDHCINKKPLYLFDGKISTISDPSSVPIKYDDVQKTFILCVYAWSDSFNDLYTTRKECAINASKNILSAEGI